MNLYSAICLIFLVFMATGGRAFTIFKPECSLPQESVNYVATPSTRSTLHIVWQCFFTIIVCTWSIHHFNIPQQKPEKNSGKWVGAQQALWGIWMRFHWMLLTIVVPEYTLMAAMRRRVSSRIRHLALTEVAKAQNVPWSVRHSIFAQMGGFVLRRRADDTLYDPRPAQKDDPDSFAGWGEGVPVGSPACSWGFLPQDQTPQVVKCEPGELPEMWIPADTIDALVYPFHLTPQVLLRLSSLYHFRLPNISEDELKDRSKSDAFTKLIAVVQVSIVCAEVITRSVRNMAVSQLEISVLAFSACAILIGSIYWKSPHDVQVAVTVQYLHPFNLLDVTVASQVSGIGKTPIMFDDDRYEEAASTFGKPPSNHATGHIFDFSFSLGILGSAFVGAPHLLGWNYKFPTPVEGLLWRACSSYCTGVGLVWTMIFFIPFFNQWTAYWKVTHKVDRKLIHFHDSLPKLPKWSIYLFWPAFIFYVLARLFLVTESLRTLWFLPPEVFEATWTANFPLFG